MRFALPATVRNNVIVNPDDPDQITGLIAGRVMEASGTNFSMPEYFYIFATICQAPA